MRKLAFAFIILLFAVWIGFLIHKDPGYILITYQKWSLETSLWVGVVCLFAIFILFYGLMRLFRHTSQLGRNLALWNKERRERKAGEQTNNAFDNLIEMKWSKAEDLFAKSAKDSTCPVINYSAAAYAAQQQLNFKRRNNYLTTLSKHVSNASKTAKLVETYFYIQSDQWQEALKTLLILEKKYSNDPAVIRFLARTYEALNEWDNIELLLPKLEKSCDEKEVHALKIKVYSKLIKKAIHPEWLSEAWEKTPKSIKQTPQCIEAYAIKARELRQDASAIPLIENYLKKHWNLSLVRQYGKLRGDQLGKQIQHAEGWLKKHPNEHELLICLGALCIDEKLWGKASDYLNQAKDMNATSDVYYLLGRLAEETDKRDEAITHYQAAFQRTD